MSDFRREMIRNHFDKLLLTVVFLVMMSGVYWGLFMVRHNPQLLQSIINWLREETNTILGTLLGLCTGYALGKAAGMTASPVPPDPSPKPIESEVTK